MFEFSIVGFGKPEWADFPTIKCYMYLFCHYCIGKALNRKDHGKHYLTVEQTTTQVFLNVLVCSCQLWHCSMFICDLLL